MIDILNRILWAIASGIIIISSFYFSKKLKFVQLNVKKILKSVLQKENNNSGISPFSTLMLTLAGKIGVGSIAGVALAIYIGGPGTIFWMWIISIFSAANTFLETYIGIKYNEIDERNIYIGGPSYYIKNALKKKKLAIFCAILIIFCYLVGFIPIQANTIVKSINSIVSFNPIIIGLILCSLTFLIIFGGLKKISNFSNKIVPIMTFIYTLSALIIIIKNINLFPNILLSIVKGAFNFKSFFSGFMTTLIMGIQRGIFANEAGLGTSSIASSTTKNNPIKTSFIQVLGIYITTLFICTATAFIILSSDFNTISFQDLNGIELTQYAFTYHLGFLGNIIIFISILLFSFSTIITGYYYIESNIKFFKKTINKKKLILIKIIILLFLFIGCIISSNKLWNIVDILIALLAIINTYSLLKIEKIVKKDYSLELFF